MDVMQRLNRGQGAGQTVGHRLVSSDGKAKRPIYELVLYAFLRFHRFKIPLTDVHHRLLRQVLISYVMEGDYGSIV